MLSACSTTSPGSHERLPVPPHLLTCAAQPRVSDAVTDVQLAERLVAVARAGQDCRDKLAAVRNLLTAD